jgi:hypothetical protein
MRGVYILQNLTTHTYYSYMDGNLSQTQFKPTQCCTYSGVALLRNFF